MHFLPLLILASRNSATNYLSSNWNSRQVVRNECPFSGKNDSRTILEARHAANGHLLFTLEIATFLNECMGLLIIRNMMVCPKVYIDLFSTPH